MSTPAELYDLLQTYFGIGGYDGVIEERVGSAPWYKERANEIGKLKRMLASRKIEVDTMVQAAQYCHDHHIPITATWQVIDAIPSARRAARDAQQRPLSERLLAAAAEAHEIGEDVWAVRLAGATSEEALVAWEAYRA